jgi:predicted nucleic acid-binding protein
VLGHPFVAGEIALGRPGNPEAVLGALDELPQAVVAGDAEVRLFISRHRLAGSGIGYVDAHLLAATALTQDARLWTRDRRLAEEAARLGLAAPA